MRLIPILFIYICTLIDYLINFKSILIMFWIIIIVLIVVGYFYYRAKKGKQDGDLYQSYQERKQEEAIAEDRSDHIMQRGFTGDKAIDAQIFEFIVEGKQHQTSPMAFSQKELDACNKAIEILCRELNIPDAEARKMLMSVYNGQNLDVLKDTYRRLQREAQKNMSVFDEETKEAISEVQPVKNFKDIMKEGFTDDVDTDLEIIEELLFAQSTNSKDYVEGIADTYAEAANVPIEEALAFMQYVYENYSQGDLEMLSAKLYASTPEAKRKESDSAVSKKKASTEEAKEPDSL